MKRGLVLAINLRASQALSLWREVNLDLVHKDDIDLSYRQITILLTIYLEQPPHTVRGLAKQLNVTKPVITRALDTMGKRGLVSRIRDEDDKRNVIIQRTVEGALYVETLGDAIQNRARLLPI